MDKKNTILQVLPSLVNGGVERGVIDLTLALKKNHFIPIVVSSGGELVFQLTEAEILHIRLPVNSKNPLIIIANIFRIKSIIKKYGVDIIHVRSRAPMISAYFASKKTNAKLVSTVHGIYSLKFLWWKNFSLKNFYNSFMIRATRVIAVSECVKKYILENYKLKENIADKITVIVRGVDIAMFNPSIVSGQRIIELSKKWDLPEDKKIIMLPARITGWKGHELLIDSLKKVKNDFFCILVGSDNDHKKFRKKLENKILKDCLGDKIKFVGLCKEMPTAYAISNVVISSSVLPEAFGRIAIETGAMKKIIIATNIGGSTETIVDKNTGFLVEVGNSSEIASAIDNVLSLSKEEYCAIGNSARSHIEQHFSSQKMCEKTVDVYRELLYLMPFPISNCANE
jgi:glycosyltransferase involved in cell wall biosynthesis